MLAREKALDVLVDEEKPEELRVGERDRDEPRRGDRKEEQAARKEVQARPPLPVALDQRIEHDRARGQYDPDQTLGEHRERRGGPGN